MCILLGCHHIPARITRRDRVNEDKLPVSVGTLGKIANLMIHMRCDLFTFLFSLLLFFFGQAEGSRN